MTPKIGTRVTICLPSNDHAQRLAIAKVVDHINKSFGGSTLSIPQTPVFSGYWVDRANNESAGKVVYDDISLLIVDIERELKDDLLRGLEDLRKYVFDRYEEVGSPQDEIWLIAHPTVILT